MRVITLDEHFVTESFLRATKAGGGYATPPSLASLYPKLLETGAGRIAAMDEAGIDFQILSLAALGVESLSGEKAGEVAWDVNDGWPLPFACIRLACEGSRISGVRRPRGGQRRKWSTALRGMGL